MLWWRRLRLPALMRTIHLSILILLGLLLVPQTGIVHSNQGQTYTQFFPIMRTRAFGENVLANPSFEADWYHPNGIPELQIPTGWTFSWEEGANPFAPEPWNEFVRPEVRVLPSQFLPPDEHELFIWDGDQTLKVFKGFGSISYTLQTEVTLQPGAYTFEVYVYPDLVVDYVNGEKVFAPDPNSGEVKLDVGLQTTGWLLPTFGEKNRYHLTFSTNQATTVTIKASFRGRWAIRNNGWFMDDWGVYRLE